MTACDITGPCAQNALVAVNEAIANAMEHACANGSEGTVHITARATVDRLYTEVADTGIWWDPEPRRAAVRGRGVPLMRRLMDHVTLTSGSAGTTVSMDTRVTR
ncbi:ATP-binding protein [Streptomyces californicus]|uniref:ATP-binding protein n=1 Tax=Streptomyces californicus TaxID=67351 RepID=UPI00369CE5BB